MEKKGGAELEIVFGDLSIEGSYDDAFKGCDGIIHTGILMYNSLYMYMYKWRICIYI